MLNILAQIILMMAALMPNTKGIFPLKHTNFIFEKEMNIFSLFQQNFKLSISLANGWIILDYTYPTKILTLWHDKKEK